MCISFQIINLIGSCHNSVENLAGSVGLFLGFGKMSSCGVSLKTWIWIKPPPDYYSYMPSTSQDKTGEDSTSDESIIAYTTIRQRWVDTSVYHRKKVSSVLFGIWCRLVTGLNVTLGSVGLWEVNKSSDNWWVKYLKSAYCRDLFSKNVWNMKSRVIR